MTVGWKRDISTPRRLWRRNGMSGLKKEFCWEWKKVLDKRVEREDKRDSPLRGTPRNGFEKRWKNRLTAKTNFAKKRRRSAVRRRVLVLWQVKSEREQDFEFRFIKFRCERKPVFIQSTGEFDSGSDWTLAACLTHASRTWKSFGMSKVAHGWVTRG